MSDNTILNTGSGGDTIATDDVTTLNGSVSSGVKVQRLKNGFGPDATYRDVSGGFPLPVDTDSKRVITYHGRLASFRIPGRAGTTGQKMFSIFNASATVLVDVESLMMDYYATVAKTVFPPTVRIYRITAAPTNGTALTNKVAFDSTQTSNASITFVNDASADGTSSTTAMTHATTIGTVTNMITQMFAPRNLSLVGYEMWDRQEFLDNTTDKITLRQNEGVLVMLDYNTATSNPTTDMYSFVCDWTEYTAST